MFIPRFDVQDDQEQKDYEQGLSPVIYRFVSEAKGSQIKPGDQVPAS